MGGNLVLDSCTGMIPIAGAIVDALFQANLANMQVRRLFGDRADFADPRDRASPIQVGRHRASTASLVVPELRQARAADARAVAATLCASTGFWRSS